MTNNTMLSRRALLAGAAAIGATAQLATMVASTAQEAAATVAAVDVNTLERVKVDLVAPPFVHAHELVAPGAPRIV